MKSFIVTGLLLALAGVAFCQVICPDQKSQCPPQNTCCKLTTGQWGCCPMPKAKCCSDHLHCCPHGYTCNVTAQTCKPKAGVAIPWYPKTVATSIQAENVICPGGRYQCPSGNTCCRLASGQWGCCPSPNAVCCPDRVHCCPHGYTCSSAGTCTRAGETIPWVEKSVAIQITAENVICPGGQYQCPPGNTCCRLASGQWGCCPSPNAVCCPDHIHCCPHGYTCSSTGTCTRAGETIPWSEKSVAIQITAENVFCPGGKQQCPSGNTCCMLANKEWGCCPLPNAVCCPDHIHCCPHGYKCNAGTCKNAGETIPWSEKSVAIQVTQAVNTVCPGGQYTCPTGTTCCKQSGGWGCCPLPMAVCCSDQTHCCPHGYKCDVSAGTCTRASESIPWSQKSVAHPVTVNSIPWLTKIPAIVSDTESANVNCDGKSQCPDGNTCCKLASGQWGCCPLPKAVCCSDGIHCCPNGYTCDVSKGSCSKKEEIVAWSAKTHAVAGSVGNVQCNATAACPNGDTCCKLRSGRWGCCTFTNGVCCNDHLHCCPSGTTCTATPGKCTKKFEEIAWSTQTLALPSLGDTVKCDAKTTCPNNFTCCRIKNGWGCCPQPKATCCSDHVHCCPSGYKCNPKGTCDK